MKKPHSGFTLVELMIAIVIIGILAAIAIPQYSNYIIRTQLARAYSEANAVRTGLEICMLYGKTNMTTVDTAPEYCNVSYTASNILSGAPQDTMITHPPGTGFPFVNPGAALSPTAPITITSTFGNSAHGALHGTTLIQTRNNAGSWRCDTGGTIPPRYLPRGCDP